MITLFSDANMIDLRRFCGFPFDLGLGVARCDYSAQLFRAVTTSLNKAQHDYVVASLDRIRELETDVYAVRQLMQVQGAEGFQRDTEELTKRVGLYNAARFQLVAEMGIAPGPALAGLAYARLRRTVS